METPADKENGKIRSACKLEGKSEPQQGQKKQLRGVEEVLIVAKDVEEKQEHGKQEEKDNRSPRETGQAGEERIFFHPGYNIVHVQTKRQRAGRRSGDRAAAGRERVMRNYWYIPSAVLLVLVLVGFFAGWIQLSLGPDTWAVVFTTSRGFEKTVINPSGFTWRWERLVPRAITLYRIVLSTEKADAEIRSLLPSAEAYSALMSERPDFSVDIKLSALYRIRPDALPELVANEGLRQENIGDWYDQVDSEIQKRATELALGMANGTPQAPDPSGQALDASAFSAELVRGLKESFPRLDFISISPVILKMPDAELYAKLRSAYLNLVDSREKALSQLAPRQVAEDAGQLRAAQRQEATIAILTRYGELLAKYPALIKFLFLATSQKLTPKDLQTLDLLDKLGGLE